MKVNSKNAQDAVAYEHSKYIYPYLRDKAI